MARKYLDDQGLLYVLRRLKSYIESVVPTKQSDLTNDDYTVKDPQYSTYKGKIDTLEQTVQGIVTTGGEANVLEAVQVNGTALPINNKTVNVAITTGTTNGSLSVNGTDVSVAGLQSAAYMASTAFDPAGSANVVLGMPTDTAGTTTVYGAIASANAANTAAQNAQAGVTAINNAGYQTASQVATTVEGYGYQTANQVSSAIASALNNITGISYEIVATLPAEGAPGVIYLINNNGSNPNIYDEYIYVETDGTGSFEKIGTTDVDLSNYLQTSDIISITNGEIDTIVTTADMDSNS